MSFGFSPSDIVTLITLTKKAYDGYRSAGSAFADICQTLRSFKLVLEQIRHRFDHNEFAAILRRRASEVDDILDGCRSAVEDLSGIVRRYGNLRPYDRMRFGMKDISGPKERLVRHLALLTPFVLMVEMEGLGKDVQYLPNAINDIPNIIQNAMTVAIGQMIDLRTGDGRSTRSSVLTTYGEDDKQAYKELRRQLHKLGIRDSDIRKHKPQLVDFVKYVVTEDETCHLTVTQPDLNGSGASGVIITESHAVSRTVALCSNMSGQDIDVLQSNAQSASHDRADARLYQAYVESEEEIDDLDGGTDDQNSDAQSAAHDRANARLYQAYVESEEEVDDLNEGIEKGAVDGHLMEAVKAFHLQPTYHYAAKNDGNGTDADDSITTVAANVPSAVVEESMQEHMQESGNQKSDNELFATSCGTGPHFTASPSDLPVPPTPPPRYLKPLLLEYMPLRPEQEHSLTVQFTLPSEWSVHIEKEKIVQFLDRSAASNARRFHASLPKGLLGLCTHGFPSARIVSQIFNSSPCHCHVLQWTPEMEYWNPKFLNDLRGSVGGVPYLSSILPEAPMLLTESEKSDDSRSILSSSAVLSEYSDHDDLFSIQAEDGDNDTRTENVIPRHRTMREKHGDCSSDLPTFDSQEFDDLFSIQAEDGDNDTRTETAIPRPRTYNHPSRASPSGENPWCRHSQTYDDVSGSGFGSAHRPSKPDRHSNHQQKRNSESHNIGGVPNHSSEVADPFQAFGSTREPRTFQFSKPPSGFGGYSDPKDIFAYYMRGGGAGMGGSSADADIFFRSGKGGKSGKGDYPGGWPDTGEQNDVNKVTVVEKPLPLSLEDVFRGVTKKLKVACRIYNHWTGEREIESKILVVPIRKGLNPGSKIKYRDFEDQEGGAGRQDLHFITTEKPHPRFMREGYDLRTTLDITLDEARDGWARIVPTLDGDNITVRRSGPTPSTWEDKYPELGMPNSKTPNKRGDLIVGVRITV